MICSGSASAARVLGFTLLADRSAAVPPGCAVFVRGGTAAWQTRGSDVLMDVNHALLFPAHAEPAVLTAVEGDAELTLFQLPRADFGAAPCVRLIDSVTFLEQYRIALRSHDPDVPGRIAKMIVSLHASSPDKPASQSAHSPSYGRSIQLHVNATLALPFRLRHVAQSCALSPFTVSRVFRREAGIPLRIYVRRLRVRTALTRVAAGAELSAIAQEFGFFDHAHFTKAFRAEFGIAPSQWREFVASALREAA
jgi:AraC-like DNA-binding protein